MWIHNGESTIVVGISGPSLKNQSIVKPYSITKVTKIFSLFNVYVTLFPNHAISNLFLITLLIFCRVYTSHYWFSNKFIFSNNWSMFHLLRYSRLACEQEFSMRKRGFSELWVRNFGKMLFCDKLITFTRYFLKSKKNAGQIWSKFA